ncbi:MAG TPA: sugar transferase [Thermoanaerobaculia bacterium]|nr:sugar transferase [Thermoanaerobaculia bacterium]
MIHKRSRVHAALCLTSDVLAIGAAFFVAWWLRFETDLLLPLVGAKPVPHFEYYLRLLPFLAVAFPAVFYFRGLYEPRRGRSRVEEALSILLAAVIASLLVTGLSSLYRPPEPLDPNLDFTYSRGFLGAFALSSYLFVATGRLLIRETMRAMRRRGHNLSRILIIGAGRVGREVTQKILDHRELGFEVVGFLDDKKPGGEVLGRPILGTLKDLPEVLGRHPVDQVMIALPLEAKRKTMRILDHLGKECVEVRMVPDVLEYTALKASLEDLDGTPLINLSRTPLEGWNSFAKRVIDVALSTLLLILCAPFLAMVAIAIWWEDRGPAFYRQERMGIDGKSFHLWKLRSMRHDAEASTGPIWAIRDDPRRTRIGRFLRRTSLDELPQLWNVLVGEMSLVGPRPPLPYEVELYDERQRRRLTVKPGLTGLWQVSGRNRISYRDMCELDLEYIRRWSHALDALILLRTLPVVFLNSGRAH